MHTVAEITEDLRLPSPTPKPFGLVSDGTTMWLGGRETQRLYALDVATWTVREEAQSPGGPFGMTMVGDELRVIVGAGEDDDRYIYRFIPGHGFKNDRLPCPECTGAHVAFDGDTLFVTQATNKRILALDAQGVVLREIPLGRIPLGMAIADGCFYLITGDDEFENLQFDRVDARGENPATTTLALIPFDARALTYDGSRFWTSHRDNNEVVAFKLPVQ